MEITIEVSDRDLADLLEHVDSKWTGFPLVQVRKLVAVSGTRVQYADVAAMRLASDVVAAIVEMPERES